MIDERVHRPLRSQLSQIQGMGEIKVAKFGDAILSIIND